MIRDRHRNPVITLAMVLALALVLCGVDHRGSMSVAAHGHDAAVCVTSDCAALGSTPLLKLELSIAFLALTFAILVIPTFSSLVQPERWPAFSRYRNKPPKVYPKLFQLHAALLN